jgi:hypothetical protein
MKNLLSNKIKYYSNFANAMYAEYRKLKYGITTCKLSGKKYLDEIRKSLVDYQVNDDGNALCAVSINTMGWLPVTYSCNSGKTCSSNQVSINMSYTTPGASTNIIEVNTGGCITRINVNPTIVINGTPGYFTYVQNCADPQSVWTIVHNLGFVPNAWTEDCNGDDISGTLAVINNNTISITFSSPQAGKAYLS